VGNSTHGCNENVAQVGNWTQGGNENVTQVGKWAHGYNENVTQVGNETGPTDVMIMQAVQCMGRVTCLQDCTDHTRGRNYTLLFDSAFKSGIAKLV
jgi:coenzyme F420-reducing hydrogenase gamma subunit